MGERDMRTRTLLIFAACLLSLSAFGTVKPMSCQTNFGEKSFTIEGNSIAFHNVQAGRGLSSVLPSKTKVSVEGFSKTVYKDGYKHLIHIENTNNLNAENDFLAITSPKGHKMTFPIHCSLLD